MRVHDTWLNFTEGAPQPPKQRQVIIAIDPQSCDRDVALLGRRNHVVHRSIALNEDDQPSVDAPFAQPFQQEEQMAFGAADASHFDDMSDAHEPSIIRDDFRLPAVSPRPDRKFGPSA